MVHGASLLGITSFSYYDALLLSSVLYLIVFFFFNRHFIFHTTLPLSRVYSSVFAYALMFVVSSARNVRATLYTFPCSRLSSPLPSDLLITRCSSRFDHVRGSLMKLFGLLVRSAKLIDAAVRAGVCVCPYTSVYDADGAVGRRERRTSLRSLICFIPLSHVERDGRGWSAIVTLCATLPRSGDEGRRRRKRERARQRKRSAGIDSGELYIRERSCTLPPRAREDCCTFLLR